jgi:signal transduction histidine kinase
MKIIENDELEMATFARIANFLPYPFIMAKFKNNTYVNAYLNERFLEEIGYTVSEIPTIDDWFQKAYPDSVYRLEVISQWNQLLEEAKRDGRTDVKMNVRIATKKRGEHWYEVKSSTTENTHLVAFVNIQDIISKEEQLRQINSHKDKMLSILSHDIRGPIGNIHALINMTINSQLTQDEFKDLATKVNERTFKVLELIETTLQWARSNFDEMNLRFEKINVAQLTQEVLTLYKSTYDQKKIVVDVDVKQDQAIFSDRLIISAILRNIISNAIKFTPSSGRIIINSNGSRITMEDNGVGMSEETITNILNRRYSPGSGAEKENGAGIGLKLVLDLLDKINAKMSIVSKRNVGTQITIDF